VAYYNGQICVIISYPNNCTQGWTWNSVSQNCTSLNGSIPNPIQNCVGGYWNGQYCVSSNNPNQCATGWVWSWVTYTCSNTSQNIQCNANSYWNGQICVSNSYPNLCIIGWSWNWSTRQCMSNSTSPTQNGICPVGYFWDGTACKTTQNVCATGYNYVSSSGSCVLTNPTQQCPTNYYYNWTQDSCFLITTASCPTSYYWNGAICTIFVGTGVQTCIQGTNWSYSSKTCVPFSSNGSGSTNSNISDQPVCRNGLTWNGRMCILCNSPSYWNGATCSNVFPIVCQTGTWTGSACL